MALPFLRGAACGEDFPQRQILKDISFIPGHLKILSFSSAGKSTLLKILGRGPSGLMKAETINVWWVICREPALDEKPFNEADQKKQAVVR